jgi:hypothetical protein
MSNSIQTISSIENAIICKSNLSLSPIDTNALLSAHVRLAIPSTAIHIRVFTLDLDVPFKDSWLAAVVAVAPRYQNKSL